MGCLGSWGGWLNSWLWSAQVLISGSWVQDSKWAPCWAWSLLKKKKNTVSDFSQTYTRYREHLNLEPTSFAYWLHIVSIFRKHKPNTQFATRVVEHENPGAGLNSLDSKVYPLQNSIIGINYVKATVWIQHYISDHWASVLDFGCSEVMRAIRPFWMEKRIKKRDAGRPKEFLLNSGPPLGPKPSFCW